MVLELLNSFLLVINLLLVKPNTHCGCYFVVSSEDLLKLAHAHCILDQGCAACGLWHEILWPYVANLSHTIGKTSLFSKKKALLISKKNLES